ncbi:hypothetical protein Acid7E03_36400 [Acidisoma sp. 7E03]
MRAVKAGDEAGKSARRRGPPARTSGAGDSVTFWRRASRNIERMGSQSQFRALRKRPPMPFDGSAFDASQPQPHDQPPKELGSDGWAWAISIACIILPFILAALRFAMN